MKKFLFLFLVSLMMMGCKTVSIQIDDGHEKVNIKVPFSMIKTAMSFTDEDVLEIEDLAGVDQEIDLKALAEALRSQGDQMKVHLKDGDSVIHGEMQGQVFNLSIDNPEEEQIIRMNLPMALISRIADAKPGETLNTNDFLKALNNYSGVLIQVESPQETVKITLR